NGEPCSTFWDHQTRPEEELHLCTSGSYAGWHTYGVDWEPGVLKFYYDGIMVHEVTNSHVNSAPQYLIMNESPAAHSQPAIYPNEILVDYVRVWQHPVPPTATTLAPTEVQQTSARLNGSVNPNGADTHYYFEYGPTTSYGSVIPAAAPGTDL